jgi:hypothetical protein
LPAAIVADALNWRFKQGPVVEMKAALNTETRSLRAATSTTYGRIWDYSSLGAFRDVFGNGANGNRWHVPMPFNGPTETITKENTTFYRGDRDWFIFMADKNNGFEVKNRRHGESGVVQRGFYAWGSEVGHRSQGMAAFGFDHICCNRLIWGMTGFEERRIRHTVGGPDRFFEEMVPSLTEYANSSTVSFQAAIAAAQERKLGNVEKVSAFLADRFGARMVAKLQSIHNLEEQRPIETVFDVVTAATAYARQIPWIGARVEMEKEAGKLLVAA